MSKHLYRVSILLIFICFATVPSLYAQHDPILHGDTLSGLYVMYKVQRKDNLFSIGRKYDLRYQEIIDFNNFMDASISVGQEIKIPITRANFINKDIELNSKFLPLVHVVKPKEGLFRVGINHYRTRLQVLMKWNELKNYNLKVNQKLVVGYIKPKDAIVNYIGNPNKYEGASYVPPLRSSEESSEANKIVQQNVDNQAIKVPSTVPIPATANKEKAKGGEGFFKQKFEEHWSEGTKGQKTRTIRSTLFNSNTGWNDSKYYGMSETIPAQSIVEVVYPNTNKRIYVKVLGGLPEVHKSKGYKLIISRAGAEQLGIRNVGEAVDLKCTF